MTRVGHLANHQHIPRRPWFSYQAALIWKPRFSGKICWSVPVYASFRITRVSHYRQPPQESNAPNRAAPPTAPAHSSINR